MVIINRVYSAKFSRFHGARVISDEIFHLRSGSFQASFLQALFFFITPIVYAFFVSMVGLIANLFMPNFSWQNEVTVIKQSAATLIAMLVGMFSAALPTVLFFTVTAFGPAELLTILSLLFIIIDMGLGIFLKQNGERMFRAL